MVKKAALKTAGISMAGFQPRTKVFDGQTPAAAAGPGADQAAAPGAGVATPAGPLPAATGPAAAAAPGAGLPMPRPAGKPFTGVGSVMAAITREADLTQELAGTRAALGAAQQQLQQFQSAELVQTLDARSVRRSQWANRNEAEFGTPEFAALKQEIAGANGNVQPIKVRRIAGAGRVFDGQTPVFEIVYGHRRHRACLELGLPVQAVVADSMDDRALFEAMDRENRSRKNLSAWEQGRMYDEALRQGLYASLRRLADALGVNLSDASRAVQLAKLPAEMVAAFASPLDLQVRWAKPLADALQRDPDGVLQRSRRLAAEPTRRAAADVFAVLAGTASLVAPDGAARAEEEGGGAAAAEAITVGRRRLAQLRSGAQGRLVVEFEPGAVPPARRPQLLKLLKAFLADGDAG